MKRAKICRVAVVIFIIGFLCSLALSLKSFASANIFKIQNVELTELSATAEGSIWSFDEATIASDVTFHKLNDTAKYTITFKNTDTVEHTIRAITDNNASPFVTFYYDRHANEVINAGEEFTLVVTVKYENEIAVSAQRLQADVTKFVINIANVENVDEFTMVPDTGANTAPVNGEAIKNNVVILIISALGLVIAAVVYVRKHKKAAGVIVALVAVVSFATITTTVRAITFNAEGFTISTRFTIADRYVLIWVDENGNEHEKIVPYGEAANINDIEKDGYNFVGWLGENGTSFDVAAVMTGDAKISPVLEPIIYTIEIDTDGDGDADITRVVNYEQSVNLPENNNTKDGHQPNGWKDSNGNHYDDGEDISGLITDDGGTITLVPDFAPNHYTVDIDTDGDGNTDTSLNVTYGEETNLPNNEASKPGHHPNGWTDGNGHHYDDGDDISGLLIDNGNGISLVPEFTPNTYIVNIDTNNDGNADISLDVTYGETANLPENLPADEGYKPNGWTDGNGNHYDQGEDISDLLIEHGDEISLRPVYLPIQYTLAIDTDNDGNADTNMVLAYDERRELPTNAASWDGYIPDGWLIGEQHYVDEQMVVNLTTVDGAIINVSPDFTPRTINVCYNGGANGVVGDAECETAKYDSSYTVWDNYFTRTGYTPVNGWATEWNGTKEFDGGGEYNPNADILACVANNSANCTKTMSALWTPNKTTIVYAPGVGVTDATGTVANGEFTYDQSAQLTDATYSRPGYVQTGWVDEDGNELSQTHSIDSWTNDVATYTYNAIWTPRKYSIEFHANADDATGSMDTISDVYYDGGGNLPAGAYSREYYMFVGWKRDNTGSLITNGVRSDRFLTTTDDEVVHLYAQWSVSDYFSLAMRDAGNTKMTANDGKQYFKMQDMTTDICSFVPAANSPYGARLVDTRDGKVYWVSKLKDGKCWMTQNLDLDLSTSKTLTPADTDITANWAPATSTYNPSNMSSWQWGADGSPYSLDPGNWYWTDTYYSSAEYNYLSSGANAQFKQTQFTSNGEHGHIGNYYNFAAAIASNNMNQVNAGAINTSICPKGWTLPQMTEYQSLLNAYGGYVQEGAERDRIMTASPLYFIRGGWIANTSSTVYQLLGVGNNGQYWTNMYTSGMMSIKQAFRMQFTSDAIQPYYAVGSGVGNSVRCVAR